jgi:hypothetical protein
VRIEGLPHPRRHVLLLLLLLYDLVRLLLLIVPWGYCRVLGATLVHSLLLLLLLLLLRLTSHHCLSCAVR